MLWDYTDYDGGSRTYTGSRGCSSPGISYGISYVGDYWNDDFSSGWGSSGCYGTVYQHANHGSPSYGSFYSASSFHALNDEVSSARFGY